MINRERDAETRGLSHGHSDDTTTTADNIVRQKNKHVLLQLLSLTDTVGLSCRPSLIC